MSKIVTESIGVTALSPARATKLLAISNWPIALCIALTCRPLVFRISRNITDRKETDKELRRHLQSL